MGNNAASPSPSSNPNPIQAVLVYDEALVEDISAGQYMYYDRGVWHEFRSLANPNPNCTCTAIGANSTVCDI